MPRRNKRSRTSTLLGQRRSIRLHIEKELARIEKRKIGYISPPESIWVERLSQEQPPPEAGTAMVMECEEVDLECATADQEHLMKDIQEDTTTDQAQVTHTQNIETTGDKGNQAQATDIQDNELNEIKATEQETQVTEVQGIRSTEDELTKAKINEEEKAGVADIQEIDLEDYEIYINEDSEDEAVQDREQFTCTIKQEKMNPDYVCDKMNPDYVCEKLNPDYVCDKMNPDYVCDKMNPEYVGEKLNPNYMCDKMSPGDVCDKMNPDYVCDKMSPGNVCDKMEEELVCLSSEAEIVTLKQEEADFCSGSGNVLHASKQGEADFCSESSVFACGADPSQELLITQSVGIKIEPEMQFPCSSLMTGTQADVSVREESGEGGNEVKTLLGTADHLPSGTTSPTSPPADKWNKSTSVSDFHMEYGTSCSQTQTKLFTNIDKRKRTRSRMEKADDYTESAKISSAKSLSDSESRGGIKVLRAPLKRGCKLNNAVKETSVSKSVWVPSVNDKNERNIRDETNLPDDKSCTGRFQKKYMLYNEIDEKRKDRIMERAIKGLNLSQYVSVESKTSVKKNKPLSKRTSLNKDCEELKNCIKPCQSKNIPVVKSVEYIYVQLDTKIDKTKCYTNYPGISESVETQTEPQILEKPHQKVLSGKQHQDNMRGEHRYGKRSNGEDSSESRRSVEMKKKSRRPRNIAQWVDYKYVKDSEHVEMYLKDNHKFDKTRAEQQELAKPCQKLSSSTQVLGRVPGKWEKLFGVVNKRHKVHKHILLQTKTGLINGDPCKLVPLELCGRKKDDNQ